MILTHCIDDCVILIHNHLELTNKMTDVFGKWSNKWKMSAVVWICHYGLCVTTKQEGEQSIQARKQSKYDHETTICKDLTVELVVQVLVDELCFIDSSAGGKQQCTNIQEQNMCLIEKRYPMKQFKSKETRDIGGDIKNTRQISTIADIFAKLSLVFGIKNTTMRIDNRRTSIVTYIYSRYKNMICNTKAATRQRMNFYLSCIRYVAHLMFLMMLLTRIVKCDRICLELNGNYQLALVIEKKYRLQVQRENRIEDAANELSLLKQQMASIKNNISNRTGLNGSYAAEYALDVD